MSAVGDLSISLIKRKSGNKDSGNILPGHGGILDRLDGILFGVPLGFIVLIILDVKTRIGCPILLHSSIFFIIKLLPIALM